MLIAINFVREQRWPILVLLLWVLLLAILGLTTSEARNGEDLLFVFKQVALYVVAFSVFFGSSAIYNDRRSRRILSVLSKDVKRSEYLSGLVLGITITSVIYSFALGLTGSWTLGEAGFRVGHIWFLMLCLVAACALAGTVALMFSTFLNPFIAAGATAAAMGIPAALSYGLGVSQLAYLIPVYPLAATVLKSSFNVPEKAFWFPILLAIAETLAFLLLSARIFSYVDIAVSVE
ncbi:MAG TPA: hypothetical protein VMB18_04090 [Terriglobales bacterium]|jgi:ABC-type transport system involved in multi-copper enzyme maturation permease subunit|nr:hypothetical protein [Terriglobales bacterium]